MYVEVRYNQIRCLAVKLKNWDAKGNIEHGGPDNTSHLA
jgi:hypothetical protein